MPSREEINRLGGDPGCLFIMWLLLISALYAIPSLLQGRDPNSEYNKRLRREKYYEEQERLLDIKLQPKIKEK